MASSNTAWGIEIGQYAVKAIQLERVGDGVRVRDFVVIPHQKVLTTPGLEEPLVEGGQSQAKTILEQTLAQLASQKPLANQNVVVNYNWFGNRGLTRFVKLPPGDAKTIAGLVPFEASQQIPFPLEEVEWDYHTFEADDSPEVDLGLFAVQREPLKEFLTLVSDTLGVEPRAISLGPVALYNAIAYDRDVVGRGDPLVILDIGTGSTDLVVASGSRCWMRTFPLGGHSFTEAIVEAFAPTVELKYSQGDKLKQESATSKYAKQIMAAMRPVLGDLLDDVQKSLQFYETQNRGTKLRDVIGLGSTLKIPGLRKFLGMRLELEVERLDQYSKLVVEGPEAADFAAHTVNFATSYGLALQGLGMATIEINLLPVENIRQQVWSKKTRWFAAAAAVACAAGGLMFIRNVIDNGSVSSRDAIGTAEATLASAQEFTGQVQGLAADVGATATNMLALIEDREIWPHIVHDAVHAVAAGNDAASVGSDLKKLLAAGPRQQTVLRDLSGTYKVNEKGERVIEVTMNVEFVGLDKQAHLGTTVCQWLTSNADRANVPYVIENVKSNTSEIVDMKVGPSGALVSAATEAGGGSAAAGGETASAEDVDNRVSGGFSAGGGSAGSSFTGLTGRRRPTGETQVNRPGGLLGGAGTGGGFNAGSPGESEYRPDGNQGNQFQRQGSQSGASESKVDLDKVAPIPERPGIYPPDSTVHVGKVTFTVKFKEAIPAAAPAAEGM
jgi:type IV pilus assembly protein PilM